MGMWQRMRAVLALALPLAAACASGGGPGAAGKPEPPVTVVVDNRNFSDMTVTVLQSGRRVRLGMVTGLTTRRFRLPGDMADSPSDIRLHADRIGGSQGWLSPPVRVRPGEELALTIDASLQLSTVSVYSP